MRSRPERARDRTRRRGRAGPPDHALHPDGRRGTGRRVPARRRVPRGRLRANAARLSPTRLARVAHARRGHDLSHGDRAAARSRRTHRDRVRPRRTEGHPGSRETQSSGAREAVVNGKHCDPVQTAERKSCSHDMRMKGQWHVYRPGAVVVAPSKRRASSSDDEYVAPCETPPVVELIPPRVALHQVTRSWPT